MPLSNQPLDGVAVRRAVSAACNSE
jgi:hypothetical protein